VAFEILTLVGEGKGHSDELLHSLPTEALSTEDRNLATALVMGVLRWQIALDARLAKLLARPDQRLAEPVALALRMGAFQLLHLDRIPAHAVLNESVEICRAAGQPHAAGMVNAVLRKLAAAQKPRTRIFESPAAFAERLGHPLWLVERWVAAYGREAALAICEAGQHEPGRGALFVEAHGGGADAGLAGEACSGGAAVGCGARGAGVGLLRRSGGKDVDVGAAIEPTSQRRDVGHPRRGDSGDGREREAAGADDGAAAAVCVCRARALRGDGCSGCSS
jgi:16S rRNA (cytosine967-C5)-methyltransferase